MTHYTYNKNVVIHQRPASISTSYSQSSGSYSSSMGSETPRSYRSASPYEPIVIREHDAAKHQMTVQRRNEVVVVARNQTTWDKDAPTPSYSTYTTTAHSGRTKR